MTKNDDTTDERGRESRTRSRFGFTNYSGPSGPPIPFRGRISIANLNNSTDRPTVAGTADRFPRQFSYVTRALRPFPFCRDFSPTNALRIRFYSIPRPLHKRLDGARSRRVRARFPSSPSTRTSVISNKIIFVFRISLPSTYHTR